MLFSSRRKLQLNRASVDHDAWECHENGARKDRKKGERMTEKRETEDRGWVYKIIATNRGDQRKVTI